MTIDDDSVDLPLKGVRIVDFSRVLAGPLSTMLLGDLGAEVIKIERPGHGDDTRDWGIRIGETETTYYYAFNRNKKSVVLDLSDPNELQIAKNMIKDADAVVENFRPGVMERLGLGYQQLKAINPTIVACSITGYDCNTPDRNRPGYDLVAQAESGLMALNGEPDRPPLKFGVAIVDMFAGMYATQGVLAALYRARQTNEPQQVQLSLYDCAVTLSSYYGLDALQMRSEPERFGNAHPSVVPYGIFEAADGPFVLAIGTTKQFKAFCAHALGRPDLADDPRYQTNILRTENRGTLIAQLQTEIAKHNRIDLLSVLSENGVPNAEVLGLYEALTNERTRSAGVVHEHSTETGQTAHVMSAPWRFDGHRCPANRPPTLGEHSQQMIATYGGGKTSG